jgi:hypothetical protein
MNLTIVATICIVTLLYVHIVFQLKTSNDLEVFELPVLAQENLEDVCNFRQPSLFKHNDEKLNQCILSNLQEYSDFDIHVYDILYEGIPIPLEEATPLFTTKMYATYNNASFLNETMAKKYFMSLDALIRPPMTTSVTYDIMFGTTGYTTRMKYSTHYRNYFYVNRGSITIKLSPPRNTRYLQEVKKYDTQEFYSTINPWNESKKVKYIEICVPKGTVVFIPAYWWYSIRLEKDACVCSIQYTTFMNLVATLPNIAMGILQRHNTKVKVLPTYSPVSTAQDAESRTSEVPVPPL